MSVLREKKVETVERVKQEFGVAESVFITHYHGLTVAQIDELRAKMREGGSRFFVAKNTLLKLGAENSSVAGIRSKFQGPVAVAISNDPIGTAKALIQFAKENERLQLVGAYAFGQEMDADGVKRLSAMASLDELRAKLVSILQTPARSLMSVLAAPSSGVVRVLSAYSAAG